MKITTAIYNSIMSKSVNKYKTNDNIKFIFEIKKADQAYNLHKISSRYTENFLRGKK